MAKKAPRGKLLTLKPKSKAKVIPIKSGKSGKSAKAAKKKAKVIALEPKRRRPDVPPQVMPPPIAEPGDDGLREAMEELVAARQELSRLGHELTLAKRDLENRKLSSGSAQENLRAELAAVRTDLKTALAELEISRNEVERLRGKLAQNEAASASKKPAGSSPSV
jgi:hypothetical protein